MSENNMRINTKVQSTNTMTFERLRGFRDMFPEEAEPKFFMLNIADQVASSFGFQRIDMPSLESLDLYKLKSGEELVSQTFSFVDKGGREVTMIPEATPSVVRMLTSRKDLPRPVKWYCYPKLWRYEEPQSGRLREHIQFNADIFGPNTPEADAEIIGLAASILDRIGIGGEYSVKVNDRRLMETLLKSFGVIDVTGAFSVIDKFKKITREDFSSQLKEIEFPAHKIKDLIWLMENPGDISALMESIRKVISIEEDLGEIIRRLEETLNLAQKYTSSEIVIDFSVVRGLSYYTGIVFEVFDKKGEFRSILGGGRYDNLSKLISDQDIPAVGFGMGDVVLELLARRQNLWKVQNRPLRFSICVASDKAREYSIDLSRKLRGSGYIVNTDISRRSLSAQLKNASIQEYDYAIIIGNRELENNEVTIRNLTSGEQENVQQTSLMEWAGNLQKSGSR